MVAGHVAESFAYRSPLDVHHQRRRQVRAAQVRLLFANAHVGVAVTVIAAPALAYFQWDLVSHRVVLGWLLYALAVAAIRLLLTYLYSRASSGDAEVGRWGASFAAGAGLAGAGWGAAGILLYPSAELMNQVFLVFVLGGMMLGGASVLAPRSESFLAFLLPAGLLPAVRLLGWRRVRRRATRSSRQRPHASARRRSPRSS